MSIITWDELIPLAKDIIEKSITNQIIISTAESCTAGLISGILTEISGSSQVIDCGFTTYSNESKIYMLDVDLMILKKHGAVSSETAEKMSYGALINSRANLSIAVTGIAGPNGGSTEKPVGLVYFSVSAKNKNKIATKSYLKKFKDEYNKANRSDIRLLTVKYALELLQESINKKIIN